MSTEMPKPPQQRNEIVTGQQLELEMLPQNVVDHLSFPVKDYGFKSYEGFKRSLKNSLASRKDEPHVLILMGEPNSGKSRFKRDLVGDLGHKNTLEVNWGDIVKLAKLARKNLLDNEDLDPDTREKITAFLNKNYEDFNFDDMKEITIFFGQFLASIISDYQGENVLIVAEVPALTGAYVDQRFYGVDMGTRALWNLARQTGPFSDLKYRDYWAAIGASDSVRKKVKKERVKLEDVSDPRDIQKVLEEGGNVIGPNEKGDKDSELVNYAQESPNLVAIDKIESAVDRLIKIMDDKKLLPAPVDWERFQFDRVYRGEIVIEDLAKGILMNSIRPRRPSRSVLIAYNPEDLVEKGQKVDFGLDVPILNIATYLYPEILKIRNKGNKKFLYGEKEAEAYERNRGVEGDIVGFFLKYVKGDDFLDAGCGTGNDLAEIAKRTQYRGYGCDKSSSMLDIARYKNVAKDLQVADLDKEGIPFDRDFSCIYAHDVVHHLHHPDLFMHDAFQHLTKDGVLIIGTESEGDLREKITSAYFPGALEADLTRYYSIDKLERMARRAGFSDFKVERLSYPLEITEDLLATLRAKAYSVLHKIGQEEFEEGLRRLEEDFVAGIKKILQHYTLIVATK